MTGWTGWALGGPSGISASLPSLGDLRLRFGMAPSFAAMLRKAPGVPDDSRPGWKPRQTGRMTRTNPGRGEAIPPAGRPGRIDRPTPPGVREDMWGWPAARRCHAGLEPACRRAGRTTPAGVLSATRQDGGMDGMGAGWPLRDLRCAPLPWGFRLRLNIAAAACPEGVCRHAEPEGRSRELSTPSKRRSAQASHGPAVSARFLGRIVCILVAGNAWWKKDARFPPPQTDVVGWRNASGAHEELDVAHGAPVDLAGSNDVAPVDRHSRPSLARSVERRSEQGLPLICENGIDVATVHDEISDWRRLLLVSAPPPATVG